MPVKCACADALHIDKLFKGANGYSMDGEVSMPWTKRPASASGELILSGFAPEHYSSAFEGNRYRQEFYFDRYDQESWDAAKQQVADYMTSIVSSKETYEDMYRCIEELQLPETSSFVLSDVISGFHTDAADPYRLYFIESSLGYCIIGRFDENGDAILPSTSFRSLSRSKGLDMSYQENLNQSSPSYYLCYPNEQWGLYSLASDAPPDVAYDNHLTSAKITVSTKLISPYNYITPSYDYAGNYLDINGSTPVYANNTYGFYNNQYRHKDLALSHAWTSGQLLEQWKSNGRGDVWRSLLLDNAEIALVQELSSDWQQNWSKECYWGNSPLRIMDSFGSDWILESYSGIGGNYSQNINFIIPNDDVLKASFVCGDHQFDVIHITTSTPISGGLRGFGVFEDGAFLSGAWYGTSSWNSHLSGLIT